MAENTDKKIQNPAENYRTPHDILEDGELSKEDKITALKEWEYDVRDILVAVEENMAPSENHDVGALLDEIIKAIHILDPNYDTRGTTYTKQGGK